MAYDLEETIKRANYYQQLLERHLQKSGDSLRLKHGLQRIRELPLTVEILKKYRLHKTIEKLKKFPGSVGNYARSLLELWTQKFGNKNDPNTKIPSNPAHKQHPEKKIVQVTLKKNQADNVTEHTMKSTEIHSENPEKRLIKEKNHDFANEASNSNASFTEKLIKKDLFEKKDMKIVDQRDEEKHTKKEDLMEIKKRKMKEEYERKKGKVKRKLDFVEKKEIEIENAHDEEKRAKTEDSLDMKQLKLEIEHEKEKHAKKEDFIMMYDIEIANEHGPEKHAERKGLMEMKKIKSQEKHDKEKHAKKEDFIIMNDIEIANEHGPEKHAKRKDLIEMQKMKSSENHDKEKYAKKEDFIIMNDTEIVNEHGPEKHAKRKDLMEMQKMKSSEKHDKEKHAKKKDFTVKKEIKVENEQDKEKQTKIEKKHDDEKHRKRKSRMETTESRVKCEYDKEKHAKKKDFVEKKETKIKDTDDTEKIQKKLKRKLDPEDDVEGIDCYSGKSFAEALGICSANMTKKSRSSIGTKTGPKIIKTDRPESCSSLLEQLPCSSSALTVPLPSQKLNQLQIVDQMMLPEISPHYRPINQPKGYSTPRHSYDEAVIFQKHARTKVYSGNKTINTTVPSLIDLCTRVLIKHADGLEEIGAVPYFLLRPILQTVTPEKLFTIEEVNGDLYMETDDLWRHHSNKRFRTEVKQEDETYREFYLRCVQSKEDKLKSFTEKFKIEGLKKNPQKRTIISNCIGKPPREVLRKQMKLGTGSQMAKPVLSKLKKNLTAPVSQIFPPQQNANSSRPGKKVTAPLMLKALKDAKRCRR